MILKIDVGNYEIFQIEFKPCKATFLYISLYLLIHCLNFLYLYVPQPIRYLIWSLVIRLAVDPDPEPGKARPLPQPHRQH